MGVGPVALALYHQLASEKILRKGSSVCEIGSQDVVAAGFEGLVARLFKSLDEPAPDTKALWGMARGSSRDLMQALGIKYACIDTDGRHDATILDLNFDGAPPERRATFDIVANHGTTEHVFNQANAFRVIHDLTKVGGVMIHCLPFRGYANHCFFAYHPDLFEALARANGYELLGIWLTFGDSQAHLVPWNDRLLSDLSIGQNTNVLLSAALRRQHSQEFQIPFQIVYEAVNVDENAARYQYVVDGELLDGRTVKRIAVNGQKSQSLDDAHLIPFKKLLRITSREFVRRLSSKM